MRYFRVALLLARPVPFRGESVDLDGLLQIFRTLIPFDIILDIVIVRFNRQIVDGLVDKETGLLIGADIAETLIRLQLVATGHRYRTLPLRNGCLWRQLASCRYREGLGTRQDSTLLCRSASHLHL